MTPPLTTEDAEALLHWYIASGVVTAESTDPAAFADWPSGGMNMPAPPKPIAIAKPSSEVRMINPDDAPLPTEEAVKMAREAAEAAPTIDALNEAIRAFNGCSLKPGARSTVVYDGIIGGPLLVIDEAPGKEEDRIGKPFVGKAGALFDRMLSAIGASRYANDGLTNICIVSSIFWRPPGNRQPTKAETAICLPFVERFITLARPKAVLLLGNVPTQALFSDAPSISRSRGKWLNRTSADGSVVPYLPIFHPTVLLRQPGQKPHAWADLRAVKDRIHQD